MSLISEFKGFIMKGNVLDLAVGVIIGGAFQNIINSLVENIITPILLNPALKAAGVENIAEWKPGGIALGSFISAVISFLIIAFVLFMLIKGANKVSAKKEEAPAGPSSTDKLLMEIRDALKK